MIRSLTAFLALTYPLAILDSEVAPIILHRILALICIGALINVCCGANGLVKSGLLPRKCTYLLDFYLLQLIDMKNQKIPT